MQYFLLLTLLHSHDPLYHFYLWLFLLPSIMSSHATITVTFSIINQLLALCCFPRVKAVKTSDRIHGQVYLPDINWILMFICPFSYIGNAIVIKACVLKLIVDDTFEQMNEIAKVVEDELEKATSDEEPPCRE